MTWQKARSLKNGNEVWVCNYGLHGLISNETAWGYDANFIDPFGLPYFIRRESVELLAEFSDKVRRSHHLPNWAVELKENQK